MVGFTVPDTASVEFRTSSDGRAWGPWTETEVNPDEGPDAGSAEGRTGVKRMSAPVWVGEAAHLQTRLQGPRSAARPEKVEAHLIDSSGLGRSWGRRVLDRFRAAWRGTPPQAQAMVGRPDIITRSQWGADESLRRSAPSYAPRIVMGFVHQTANSNSYTRDEADDVVRAIYAYHVRSNGWSDIGYNFLVDKFGRTYEGRYGGMDKPVIGAHAGGFNTGTFGVSLIGNFASTTPPKAMRGALRRLLAWKYDVHHVNVKGSTYYTSNGSTRYAAGTTVSMKRLSGHRDASATVCPGTKTYALLPAMRDSVAELQGAVVLYPKVFPRTIEVVNGRSVSGPVNFKARLRPAGAWTITITDEAGRTVDSVSGSARDLNYDWVPRGLPRGTYRYAIGGGGRRPARGTFTAKGPVLKASVTPGTATYGADGLLANALRFTGSLYDGADGELRVWDPDGTRVLLRDDIGRTLNETWSGPFNQPGTYSWRLSDPQADSVRGTFRIYADRVDRAGGALSAAAAAAGVSRRTFPDLRAKRAVVVSSTAPGYAMSATGLAGKGGPVLYTGPDQLPQRTVTELQRTLRPGAAVYVLGNAGVVSDTVVEDLQAALPAHAVQRVAGKNPQTVAGNVADLVVARSGATSAVVVGNGASGTWRQSVAAGAYAASNGMPVLVTEQDHLSAGAAEAITRNAITATTIIGNGESVSKAVRDALPAPVRVSGTSGPRTAVAVATKLFGRTTAAPDDAYVFANAKRNDGWVRSLGASGLAARTRGPVLLSERAAVTGATAEYLTTLNYTRSALGQGVVVGDTEHVSRDTETTLERFLQ